MSTDFAITLLENMLWTALTIGAPILGVALIVGLLISIFQVVTSIQEMTLTFVPKILAIVFILLTFGHWMLTTLVTYSSELIANIPVYF
jgi:flagellar biosynthesis protein FliQ